MHTLSCTEHPFSSQLHLEGGRCPMRNKQSLLGAYLLLNRFLSQETFLSTEEPTQGHLSKNRFRKAKKKTCSKDQGTRTVFLVFATERKIIKVGFSSQTCRANTIAAITSTLLGKHTSSNSLPSLSAGPAAPHQHCQHSKARLLLGLCPLLFF